MIWHIPFSGNGDTYIKLLKYVGNVFSLQMLHDDNDLHCSNI